MIEKWVKNYGHLLDKEGAFLKAIEKLDHCYGQSETFFLSPDIAYGIEDILKKTPEISYKKWGGYEAAERVKFFLCPYGDTPKIELTMLEFSYNPKFSTIEHKDVLGALMGLGIQRERTGDILIFEGKINVFVEKDLADYIILNLDKIGRAGVKGRISDWEAIKEYHRPEKTSNINVKSLRLDAVIAAFYNLSRGEAQSLIESEKVKVNYKYILSTSFFVEIGDLISVRGYGRFELDEIEGKTKKDRIRVICKSPL